MNGNEFYKEMENKDAPSERPYGWIQWKGTDVCMDVHCVCGHHGHVDKDFFYFYKCPKCGKKYAVGAVVKLIPLTDEQASYVESTAVGFHSGTDEEE